MTPLKRHPELIELSREHHHTLALCVRIFRDPAEISHDEIKQHTSELLAHFSEEEKEFAPHLEKIDTVLRNRFESDHTILRDMLDNPQYDNDEWKLKLAEALRDHVRFEERDLFPAVEQFLPQSV